MFLPCYFIAALYNEIDRSDGMNDFEFGNFIYSLRCKSGLTQTEMAEKLGVTNKAISK